jgi:hypothetical protein
MSCITTIRRFVAILALGLTASGALASAQDNRVPLDEDVELFTRMSTTAVANEIREKCETLAARKIAATFYVLGILKYAKSLGYNSEEIDEFRFDEANQEKLRQMAHDYLDANGVDREAETGYCALGVAEIEKKSQIGKLLKSK